MIKFRYLLLVSIFVFLAGCIGSSTQAPKVLVEKYENTVVLYGTSWCGYCKRMREILDAQGVKYLEHNIETSAIGKTEFDRMGGKGIPLVLVKGTIVKGFSPEKVLELVEKNDLKLPND